MMARRGTGWLVTSAWWLTLVACTSSGDPFEPASDAGSGGSAGSGGVGASAGAGTGGGAGSAGTSGGAGAGGTGAGGAGASGGAAGAGASGGAAGTGATGTGGSAGAGGTGPVAVCGDGQLDLQADEQCDDGNGATGDGCVDCRFELVGATCGDGTVQAGEACDDSNVANGDGCNPTCNFTNTTSVFAGTPGQAGTTDGIGTAARLPGSGVLTVDDVALWLGEDGSKSLRRIDVATAQVTTIAGGGAGTFADAPTGLAAAFGTLEALGTDGTTVWVGDGANHRLRAVAVAPPHAVSTVAGNGVAQVVDGTGTGASFDGVRGLTYFAGFLYIVDPNQAVLRRFDPATGAVVTLAGAPGQFAHLDGIGTAARFVSPRYTATDGHGTLYIADTNGAAIRTYDIATGRVGTFAGSGTAGYADGTGTSAAIHRPRGITTDGTSVYFAEFNQHTIRQGVMATGVITTMLGQHCSGAATCNGGYAEGVGTAALINGPFGIAYHYPSRSLFFVDSANFVLRRVQ